MKRSRFLAHIVKVLLRRVSGALTRSLASAKCGASTATGIITDEGDRRQRVCGLIVLELAMRGGGRYKLGA